MTLPHFDLPLREHPLVLIWPAPGNPVAMLQFDRLEEWRAFVESMSLDPRIPDVVRLKFERAQKLFLLGWLDLDLLKGAELVALTALELALVDRFAGIVPPNSRKKIVRSSPAAMMQLPPNYSLKKLLRHLIDEEGLTDADLPMIVRCGGSAINLLAPEPGQPTGVPGPTLVERRNALAHGDPFDGMPISGLVELVRDLIMFAYRHYLAEAEA